ncbi:MAG TPA: hypothetical protein O0X23_00680 [Methanocorpusculum sp.]|nr:hypothetical protein [Methanocorpusculum sp.]
MVIRQDTAPTLETAVGAAHTFDPAALERTDDAEEVLRSRKEGDAHG